MAAAYVELHAQSFYSFGIGASHVHELLGRASELGYGALALTDTNLCGALDFARTARHFGVRPVTGGEMVLTDGSRIVLLAKDRTGYANLCRLFSIACEADRREPLLDPAHLPRHVDGLVLLTGGRDGPLSRPLREGRHGAAREILAGYMDWFGLDSVYVELQQNFIHGDTKCNYGLASLARECGAETAATNGVLYHVPERHRLQNALAAIHHNVTLNESVHRMRLSGESCLKSPEQMARLFRWCPEAVANTVRVAEQCAFDLTRDLGYRLPTPTVPVGYTPMSYLGQLASEAAVRRYGAVTPQIASRLEQEMRLIERHDLAGFVLVYHDIVSIARDIMIEEGLVGSETPLEERPPGRGRGSSVALLIGYLLGLSHVDPLLYDLPLDRFLPEDMTQLPDIDLDFPRAIREKLIARIHEVYGKERAVLVGAISKYRTPGVIADLGKALGLSRESLKSLRGHIGTHSTVSIRDEMLDNPGLRDRVDAPGWRELIELAPQLLGAPRRLGQHVGGMVLSTTPIPEMVPVREGAIAGRYIMDWDKDSVEDANFAKIDLLSLPVLDQLEEARNLVRQRTGTLVDISRIPPDDQATYDMIGRGEAMCVFDLQSPAQLKMGQRLLPRTYRDIAYQVALIRPGVGVQGSAVSNFVERYRHGAPWDYDHPLERRSLERGYGIIVWQEQVTQLIMDVAGMSGAEAEQIRRDFARPNNDHLIARDWEFFKKGAERNSVDEAAARKIFSKINGHYMFPESHSYAFGITAYQIAWFRCHYPVEFYVAFMNNQPMGFYPLEAIKEDARHNGVPFLNPDINLSSRKCTPYGQSVLLGLQSVRDVGAELADAIIEQRERNGPYLHSGDLVRRTGLKPAAVESLALAGAFDSVTPNRKASLWEAGLYDRPTRGQLPLAMSMDDSIPELEDFSSYEKMLDEYRTMGMHPKSHIMAYLRPTLRRGVTKAADVYDIDEGRTVTVAGWPVARQHPKGEHGTVFVTVQDETASLQLILWPRVVEKHRRSLREHVIVATGKVSRHDDTTNVIVDHVSHVRVPHDLPKAHDWH